VAEDPKKEPIQYASPVKRLWAWVGVVYMVLLILLSTYAVAHAGGLDPTLPFLLSPALMGVGGTAILRYRAGQSRGGLAACVFVAGTAFGLAALGLLRGIPAIIAQLRG